MRLDEALSRAIRIEREGAAFYRALAALALDEDTGFLLQSMATEEEEHAQVLERMRDGSLPLPTTVGPELASGIAHLATPGPTPDDGLSLEEAIEICLEAEQDAAFTYLSLARQTEDEVEQVFLRLSQTEEMHARMLAALQRKLMEHEDGADPASLPKA